ncbi:MAG: ubiquinol-cytochrome c reductase iron-sulfur subunit [Solirubrobacterales bacterium]|nr:ubiquinol-cytochrome c reductase iron-sulfur subunit [Solirubrobacterales bacterium]
MRPWHWVLGLLALVARRLRRRGGETPGTAPGVPAGSERGGDGDTPEPIVPAGSPERGAENVVLGLLGLACVFAIGFVVVYAAFDVAALPNELLGICLGGSLVCIGAALAVVAKRLVVTEELEEEYPQANPEQQREVLEIVHESGSRITRKRLLVGAGLATGGALSAAALTPTLSLGPIWDTGPLDQTPWGRGVRVVDESGRPMAAADIRQRTFYTGFPEGASTELIGAPVVIIRVDPAKLELPANRHGWAPGGILAFSKICTHAGCAVALYRKPLFPVLEPNNALVCPCHYSTFDPYTGGTVIYGPAGRPLPQLPLMVDDAGALRAAGNFSGRVGPAWWAARERPT